MTSSDPSSTRRTIVTVAVGVQLLALVFAWVLHARNAAAARPGPLVAQVLAPEDMVYADSDVAAQRGKRLPAIDVAQAARQTPEQVKEGASLFAERCAACHGEQAHGDGPAGMALTPRPRDLTSLAGWKGGTRLSDVFTTITLGLANTRMAGFDYLPAAQRFALASFVVSLARGHEADTPATLQALDKRFRLSEGAAEPNVEPLSEAARNLVAEAAAAPATVADSAVRGEEQGRAIFAAVVAPGKETYVLAWLGADRRWTGDASVLRALVVGSYPASGFTPRAALLSADEWTALERYLAARCPAPVAPPSAAAATPAGSRPATSPRGK